MASYPVVGAVACYNNPGFCHTLSWRSQSYNYRDRYGRHSSSVLLIHYWTHTCYTMSYNRERFEPRWVNVVGVTFRQPERKPWLSKRQSTPTTVLLRTTLQTRTITQTTTHYFLQWPTSSARRMRVAFWSVLLTWLPTFWREKSGEFRWVTWYATGWDSLTDSLVDSPTHSFIHSPFFVRVFVQPFIHCFTHSLTHPSIHSLVHSLIHLFTHSFIYSLTHSLTIPLVRCRIKVMSSVLWDRRWETLIS